jgi:hypothetical protein
VSPITATGTTYGTRYARVRRAGVHRMVAKRRPSAHASKLLAVTMWESVPESSGSGPAINNYAIVPRFTESRDADLATPVEGQLMNRGIAQDSTVGSLNDTASISDQDSRSVTGAWIGPLQDLDLLSVGEPEIEVSWIRFTSGKRGIPLAGPVSLAKLPRAKPRIRFDHLPEDD